ncbi:hypothetical protein AMS69_18800 [Haloarcula rubripromontorii]|uniref:Uncharacterized protein n=1 Tax=Haloarcula rubripromontorii TaxID=1705562 RepID=A0A0N0U8M7_9EURY|nr:hypothetical protein AMS69_18800 [Haloarcula rubripromontorii]
MAEFVSEYRLVRFERKLANARHSAKPHGIRVASLKIVYTESIVVSLSFKIAEFGFICVKVIELLIPRYRAEVDSITIRDSLIIPYM